MKQILHDYSLLIVVVLVLCAGSIVEPLAQMVGG